MQSAWVGSALLAVAIAIGFPGSASAQQNPFGFPGGGFGIPGPGQGFGDPGDAGFDPGFFVPAPGNPGDPFGAPPRGGPRFAAPVGGVFVGPVGGGFPPVDPGAPGFGVPVGPGFGVPVGPGFGAPVDPGVGGPVFAPGPIVPVQIRSFDLQGNGCPNQRSADLLMTNIGQNGQQRLRIQFRGNSFLVDGLTQSTVRTCTVRVRLNMGNNANPGLLPPFFGLARVQEQVLYVDPQGGSTIVRSQFRVQRGGQVVTSPVRSFQPANAGGFNFFGGGGATQRDGRAFNTPRLQLPAGGQNGRGGRNGRIDVLASLQIEVREGADAALLFDTMDLILASSF